MKTRLHFPDGTIDEGERASQPAIGTHLEARERVWRVTSSASWDFPGSDAEIVADVHLELAMPTHREWKSITAGELWHLRYLYGDYPFDFGVIRAEVRQVWYLGTERHFVITGKEERYRTSDDAMAAAEEMVGLEDAEAFR